MYTTLVTPGALAAHLAAADWIVFDCRNELVDLEAGRRAWGAGHVPGARHVSLDEVLSDRPDGSNGRHPLPPPEAFRDRIAALGLGEGMQAVAYDASGGMIAARLWWMLRWIGHARVAVLDGGWQAWTAAGHPVSDAPPAIVPAPLRCVRSLPTVDTAQIARHLGGPDDLILDARGADRFRGENETLDPIGGRIPGARNRPYTANLADDGRFKPAARLREELAALLAGMPPERVVHQCGSGVTACHNLLAMEVAGMPGGRLYPGSFSAWCADPARPVAIG